jgi:double-stranded uracil-DNA glycosylase
MNKPGVKSATRSHQHHKPTAQEIAEAAGRTVPDVIRPGLKVLFCGINPGLYTAAVGHHFARPGNRFWRAMFESGFTNRLFAPEEEAQLLSLGYGITNLVDRATATAAEVSQEELRAGAERLEERVRQFRPKWVGVVGIGAYRVAFCKPNASLGLQKERIADARVWLLPNPSGLNAHFTPKELAQVFREFRLATENEEHIEE